MNARSSAGEGFAGGCYAGHCYAGHCYAGRCYAGCCPAPARGIAPGPVTVQLRCTGGMYRLTTKRDEWVFARLFLLLPSVSMKWAQNGVQGHCPKNSARNVECMQGTALHPPGAMPLDPLLCSCAAQGVDRLTTKRDEWVFTRLFLLLPSVPMKWAQSGVQGHCPCRGLGRSSKNNVPQTAFLTRQARCRQDPRGGWRARCSCADRRRSPFP